MMDGEEVYRARLAACLAAAAAADLPQVRQRHMAAARSWQALLDDARQLTSEASAARAAALADDD